MTPSTLLHHLKLDVVGFQEDEHDYHFRVELPEPKCCQSCGTLYNLVKFGKDDQAYRRTSPKIYRKVRRAVRVEKVLTVSKYLGAAHRRCLRDASKNRANKRYWWWIWSAQETRKALAAALARARAANPSNPVKRQ